MWVEDRLELLVLLHQVDVLAGEAPLVWVAADPLALEEEVLRVEVGVVLLALGEQHQLEVQQAVHVGHGKQLMVGQVGDGVGHLHI